MAAARVARRALCQLRRAAEYSVGGGTRASSTRPAALAEMVVAAVGRQSALTVGAPLRAVATRPFSNLPENTVYSGPSSQVCNGARAPYHDTTQQCAHRTQSCLELQIWFACAAAGEREEACNLAAITGKVSKGRAYKYGDRIRLPICGACGPRCG